MNCPYCSGKLTLFRFRHTEALREHMLTPELRKILPSITHGKCNSCGSIIATDARMNSEEYLLSIYQKLPDDYWSELQSEQNDVFFSELGNLLNPTKANMTICDVGCGDGKFLDAIDECWQKFGVEPGQASNYMVNHKDITYFNGTLEKSLFKKHSMDIITYIDVFEHLINPIQEIKIAKEFLSPNGKLIIFTGDANAWSARLSSKNWIYLNCIGHITVASKKGLVNALKSSGFSNIEILSKNHPSSASFMKWLIYLTASKALGNRGSLPLFNDHMLVIASI
jgi:2-polyprenyl-3-methyl-5-hydroxy-6-metoxy-1,4-benzoquinol methylase